jgi:hypothetical protein
MRHASLRYNKRQKISNNIKHDTKRSSNLGLGKKCVRQSNTLAYHAKIEFSPKIMKLQNAGIIHHNDSIK